MEMTAFGYIVRENMFKPILFLILLAIPPFFAKTTSEKPKCGQKVCYLLFKPVCGRNSDGDEKTFSNSCFLSIDCTEPPFAFLHNGPCRKDCNIKVCDKMLNPICAEKADGEQLTFSNLCDFENRNCFEYQNEYKFLRNGKCCADDISDRVCAEDSKGVRRTFPNRCELDSLIRNEQTDFKYLMNGPCCAAKCTIINKKEVCAINSKGKTKIFPSECEIAAWNCNHGTDFKATSDKKCKKCIIVPAP